MRLVLTDLLPLLALLPLVLVVVAALAWFEFTTSRRPSTALDRDEWVLLWKLIAIPMLVLVLVTARVILTVPAGQFLYGRF